MPNRFAALVIAALLPLLLFKWFMPTPYGQIDVWLMWLAAMLAVGLPLLYAEIGLATRSHNFPVQGMQELTRQADVSTLWRSFAWLSVALSLLIAALSIDAVSARFLTSTAEMGLRVTIPDFALGAVMVVVAGLLSLLQRRTLMAALALLGLAFIVATLSGLATAPVMTGLVLTAPTWGEWAHVVLLALVSVGVASGLYWFSRVPVSKLVPSVSSAAAVKVKEAASKTVTPIWFMQLVIGSVLLLLNSATISPIATTLETLGIMAAAAFLLYYASSQIATRFSRFGIWIATLLSVVLTALLVVLMSPALLTAVLTAVSLVSALLLALFAGWKMKISHMRKALNFRSEGVYNLWRIAIRIMTPLFIVMAIVGWLLR